MNESRTTIIYFCQTESRFAKPHENWLVWPKRGECLNLYLFCVCHSEIRSTLMWYMRNFAVSVHGPIYFLIDFRLKAQDKKSHQLECQCVLNYSRKLSDIFFLSKTRSTHVLQFTIRIYNLFAAVVRHGNIKKERTCEKESMVFGNE